MFDDEVNENNEAFVAVLQLSPIADPRLIARVIPSHTATLLTILDNDCKHLIIETLCIYIAMVGDLYFTCRLLPWVCRR